MVNSADVQWSTWKFKICGSELLVVVNHSQVSDTHIPLSHRPKKPIYIHQYLPFVCNVNVYNLDLLPSQSTSLVVMSIYCLWLSSAVMWTQHLGDNANLVSSSGTMLLRVLKLRPLLSFFPAVPVKHRFNIGQLEMSLIETFVMAFVWPKHKGCLTT